MPCEYPHLQIKWQEQIHGEIRINKRVFVVLPPRTRKTLVIPFHPRWSCLGELRGHSHIPMIDIRFIYKAHRASRPAKECFAKQLFCIKGMRSGKVGIILWLGGRKASSSVRGIQECRKNGEDYAFAFVRGKNRNSNGTYPSRKVRESQEGPSRECRQCAQAA